MIDAHVHVWPKHLIPPYPAGECDEERLVEEMERSGVRRAVLIQPSWLDDGHRYLLESLRARPDLFLGVGLVDVEAGDVKERLEGLVGQGLRGVRVGASSRRDRGWLSSLDGFWSALATCGLRVNIHAGSTLLPDVATVAARYPHVRIAVDHMGRPSPTHLGGSFPELLALSEFSNVYVKVSALPYFSQEGAPHWDTLPLVRILLEEFGADRLMWGSDFAVATIREAYSVTFGPLLETDTISHEERTMILEGTAQTFYGW